MQPGQGLQRRAAERRRERRAARPRPAPRRRRSRRPCPPAPRQRRRRALEHGAGVRAAQQRLGGRLGRRTPQPAVAQHHVDAVARGRERRRRRPPGRSPTRRSTTGLSTGRSGSAIQRVTSVPDERPDARAGPLLRRGRGRLRPRPADLPARGRRLAASEQPLSVLELGAGTGKLTEQLVALGHDVHATDPDPRCSHPRGALPGVRASQAPAEEIPAGDASYDVVVGAQAFHWFDHDKALPEIARVLRPRGRLSLVWNQRDERIPWVSGSARSSAPRSSSATRPSARGVAAVRRGRGAGVPVLADRRPQSIRDLVLPLQRRRARRRAGGQAGRGARVLRRVRPRHGRHAAALRDRAASARRCSTERWRHSDEADEEDADAAEPSANRPNGPDDELLINFPLENEPRSPRSARAEPLDAVRPAQHQHHRRAANASASSIVTNPLATRHDHPGPRQHISSAGEGLGHPEHHRARTGRAPRTTCRPDMGRRATDTPPDSCAAKIREESPGRPTGTRSGCRVVAAASSRWASLAAASSATQPDERARGRRTRLYEGRHRTPTAATTACMAPDNTVSAPE